MSVFTVIEINLKKTGFLPKKKFYEKVNETLQISALKFDFLLSWYPYGNNIFNIFYMENVYSNYL